MAIIPIVIPQNGGKIDLTGPSLQFHLLNNEGKPVFEYAGDPPLLYDRQHDLYSGSGLEVASIVVLRAEPGNTITLYRQPNATSEPLEAEKISISFPILGEPTHLQQLRSKGNVQVMHKLSSTTAQCDLVTRITFSQYHLPYLVL